MKPTEFVEALERFFLDFIGTVLPGLSLLIGLSFVIQGTPIRIPENIFAAAPDSAWVLVLLVAYILGHAVTSAGLTMVEWLETAYRSDLVKTALCDADSSTSEAHDPTKIRTPKDSQVTQERWLLSFVRPEREIATELQKDPVFHMFLRSIKAKMPGMENELQELRSVRTWRNLAMSIAPEQNQLVYRFQFIALLNLGVATASVVSGCVWLILRLVRELAPATHVIEVNIPVLLTLLLVAPYFFLERYYSFSVRSLKVPFSMALAKLCLLPPTAPKTETPAPPSTADASPIGSPPVVYLAGGFRSRWQDAVKMEAPRLKYLDPRIHGIKAKEEYTVWDLDAVRKSDYVFAYLEATNPAGFALALEIGFAKALGKRVILVDEKSAADPSVARYLEMITATSDLSFTSLPDGIQFLKKLELLL